MGDGPRGGGACGPSRMEATRHPRNGQRASPGPAGVSNRRDGPPRRGSLTRKPPLYYLRLAACLNAASSSRQRPQQCDSGPCELRARPPWDCSSVRCTEPIWRTRTAGRRTPSTTGPCRRSQPSTDPASRRHHGIAQALEFKSGASGRATQRLGRAASSRSRLTGSLPSTGW